MGVSPVVGGTDETGDQKTPCASALRDAVSAPHWLVSF